MTTDRTAALLCPDCGHHIHRAEPCQWVEHWTPCPCPRTAEERLRANVARFWTKVDRRGDAECWPWLGYLNPRGYGRARVRGRAEQAHRVAFELLRGPIPAGLVIDHLCRNRGCVNPAHLEPVTNRENILRGETLPAANAAKTHCPKGHPYAGDNLRVASGFRHCKTCDRPRWEAAGRRRDRRKKVVA